MKKFLILLIALQSVVAAAELNDNNIFVTTKKKVNSTSTVVESKQTPKQEIFLGESGQCPDFTKLRTTFMKGIFCQKNYDSDSTKLKHYFYNTKTEKLVLIPDVYYVDPNDKEKLKDLQKEYEQYGEKTNVCTCQGKKYTITPHKFENFNRRIYNNLNNQRGQISVTPIKQKKPIFSNQTQIQQKFQIIPNRQIKPITNSSRTQIQLQNIQKIIAK